MQIRKVPFQALGGLFEQDDVDAATKIMQAVVDGGSFFPLPEEADFQNALAEHEGSQKAVAVNSCGTALDLCIMALGIGKGDDFTLRFFKEFNRFIPANAFKTCHTWCLYTMLAFQTEHMIF